MPTNPPAIKTTRKRLDKLLPMPGNPREISKESMAGLRASIERFGLVEPLVWNKRTGHVVGGNQRREALLAAGVRMAEVTVVDLSPTEERVLNLALNNPHIAGTFSAAVAGILAALEQEAPSLVEDMRLSALLATARDEPEAIHLADMSAAADRAPRDTIICPKCGFEFAP